MNTRAYSNSADAVQFSLPGPQALLIHQVLNEILHGIRGIRIESQVGMDEAGLKEVFAFVNGWVREQPRDAQDLPVVSFEQPLDRSYSVSEIRALRNAVELVMLELGQEEFFTRTGFSLSEAAALLDHFNAALLRPLHIEHSRVTAH